MDLNLKKVATCIADTVALSCSVQRTHLSMASAGAMDGFHVCFTIFVFRHVMHYSISRPLRSDIEWWLCSMHRGYSRGSRASCEAFAWHLMFIHPCFGRDGNSSVMVVKQVYWNSRLELGRGELHQCPFFFFVRIRKLLKMRILNAL
jgi:hypothetical protein